MLEPWLILKRLWKQAEIGRICLVLNIDVINWINFKRIKSMGKVFKQVDEGCWISYQTDFQYSKLPTIRSWHGILKYRKQNDSAIKEFWFYKKWISKKRYLTFITKDELERIQLKFLNRLSKKIRLSAETRLMRKTVPFLWLKLRLANIMVGRLNLSFMSTFKNIHRTQTGRKEASKEVNYGTTSGRWPGGMECQRIEIKKTKNWKSLPMWQTRFGKPPFTNLKCFLKIW